MKTHGVEALELHSNHQPKQWYMATVEFPEALLPNSGWPFLIRKCRAPTCVLGTQFFQPPHHSTWLSVFVRNRLVDRVASVLFLPTAQSCVLRIVCPDKSVLQAVKCFAWR